MLKMSYAGGSGPSLAVSAQFTRVSQPEIAKKLLKLLFWEFKVIQGHQR